MPVIAKWTAAGNKLTQPAASKDSKSGSDLPRSTGSHTNPMGPCQTHPWTLVFSSDTVRIRHFQHSYYF